MRTVIAGTRAICDYEVLKQAISESGINITKVLSGDARGVDKLGIQWAREHNIPVQRFKPVWYDNEGNFKRWAGFDRNTDMAKACEALIAVWDCRSKGTKHMIDAATRMGRMVFVKVIEVPDVDLTETLNSESRPCASKTSA